MRNHILQSSHPLGNVEVGISKPGVTICVRTAPHRLRDVIIQMNIESLLVALSGHHIKYLQSSGRGLDLWVHLADLIEYLGPVR
jgi:hypothetical protein